MSDAQTFDLDNIPEDARVFNSETSFEPLEDDTYQVVVDKVELKENFFYKEGAKDSGGKYVFSFTLRVLEGDNAGRLLWETAGLSLKPMTSKGPTKLYKIISKALGNDMSWEECQAFSPTVRDLYQNLLTKVVGKQLLVTTEIVPTKTGKTRNKIISFKTPKKNVEVKEEEKEEEVEEDIVDF